MLPILIAIIFFLTLPFVKAASLIDFLDRGSFLVLGLLSNPWIMTVFVFIILLLLFNYLFLVGFSFVPTFKGEKMQYAKKIALLLAIIATIGLLGFSGVQQGRFSPQNVQERVSTILSTFGVIGTWFLAILFGAITYFAGVKANNGMDQGIPFLRKYGLPLMTFGLALWLGSSMNSNQDSAGLGSALALLGLIMVMIPKSSVSQKIQNAVKARVEPLIQKAVPNFKFKTKEEKKETKKEEKSENTAEQQIDKDKTTVEEMDEIDTNAQKKTAEVKERLDNITSGETKTPEQETPEEQKKEAKKESKKEKKQKETVKKEAKKEAEHTGYLQKVFLECKKETSIITVALEHIYSTIGENKHDDFPSLIKELEVALKKDRFTKIIDIAKKEVRKIRKLNRRARNILNDLENEIKKLIQHGEDDAFKQQELVLITKTVEETQKIEENLELLELRRSELIKLERHRNIKPIDATQKIIEWLKEPITDSTEIQRLVQSVHQIEHNRLQILNEMAAISDFIKGVDIFLEKEIIQIMEDPLKGYRAETRSKVDDSHLKEQIARIQHVRTLYYEITQLGQEIEDALEKKKYNANNLVRSKEKQTIKLPKDIKDQILAALGDVGAKLKEISSTITIISDDVGTDSYLKNYLRYDEKFYKVFNKEKRKNETFENVKGSLQSKFQQTNTFYTTLANIIQNTEEEPEQ